MMDSLREAAAHLAAARAWSRYEVCAPSSLADIPPDGPPVVVLSPNGQLGEDAVTRIAALRGAGREILILSDVGMPDHVRRWVPPECWEMVAESTEPQRTELEPGRVMVLEPLAVDLAEQVRVALAEVGYHPQSDTHRIALPMTLVEVLVRDPSARVRRLVARREEVPPALLRELSRDTADDPGYGTVHKSAAGNPSMPMDVLLALAESEFVQNPPGHGSLAWPLATNARMPADILRRMGASGWEMVAANKACPSDVLAIVADSSWTFGREAVAGNPNTPPDILRALGTDVRYEVRAALAANPAAPIDLQRRLAGGQDTVARALIAEHSSDVATLWQLGRSDGPVEGLHEDAFEDDDSADFIKEAVFGGLARNPHTPSEIVEQLMAYSSPEVRSAVARRPDLSAASLTMLSRDSIASVRNAAARNHHTALADLTRLATDETPIWVVGSSCGPPVLTGVAENPRTPTELLDGLSTHDTAEVRIAVGWNPHADPGTAEAVLTALCASDDPDTRCRTIQGVASLEWTQPEATGSTG